MWIEYPALEHWVEFSVFGQSPKDLIIDRWCSELPLKLIIIDIPCYFPWCDGEFCHMLVCQECIILINTRAKEMEDARAREISFQRCSESNSVMNDIKKIPLIDRRQQGWIVWKRNRLWIRKLTVELSVMIGLKRIMLMSYHYSQTMYFWSIISHPFRLYKV